MVLVGVGVIGVARRHIFQLYCQAPNASVMEFFADVGEEEVRRAVERKFMNQFDCVAAALPIVRIGTSDCFLAAFALNFQSKEGIDKRLSGVCRV